MSTVSLISAVVVLLAIAKIWQRISSRYLAGIRHLPGPPGGSFLWGQLNRTTATYGPLQQQWAEEYGPNLRIYGILKVE